MFSARKRSAAVWAPWEPPRKRPVAKPSVEAVKRRLGVGMESLSTSVGEDREYRRVKRRSWARGDVESEGVVSEGGARDAMIGQRMQGR